MTTDSVGIAEKEAQVSPPQQAETFSTVIEATRGWSSLGLKDVWEYRELLYFLILREINGQYRQTALGLSWIFLGPVANMILLSLVFGQLIKVPSDDLPYPLFSLSALLPWTFFSNAVWRSSGSLVSNMGVISKVYFPRLVTPLSGALSGLVNFGASFLVFMVMLAVYRMPLRWEMLLLPLFLLVALAFGLALGLWLATLSVKYHDVQKGLGFFMQALMYTSPVIYSVSLVPERLRFLYQLNPMTGVIQGFRWALLGSGEAPGVMFLVAVGVVFLLLVGGAYVFRRTERTIVDIL